MAEGASADQPAVLAGVRVLDLSTRMSGAITTMLLADFGAEVIKVEPPGGDPERGQAAFVTWHRGKQSLVADLKTPAGLARVCALAAQADVMVTSWRPGVAERLGLGYEPLAAANPRLIHCAITGFGAKGPWAAIKGYDGVVAAKAGVYTKPGDRPRYTAVPGAAFGAAHGALQGILSALYQRETTGQGQRVETSLLQGIHPYDMYAWLDQPHLPRDLVTLTGAAAAAGTTYAPISGLIAFTRDHKCLQFASYLPHQRAAMLEALGLTAAYAQATAAEDPPEPLMAVARQRVAAKAFAEWEAVFAAYPDVTVDAFRTGEEAMDHPQLIHNGDVVTVQDSEHGPIRQVGPFVQLIATPGRAGASAPRLGQHDGLAGFASSPRAPKPDARPAGRPPLEGVTILELAWFYAAPYGAALLADLGARVIKVENLEGDPHRKQAGVAEFSGVKGLQGKESVAVDTTTPEGLEIVHRLVARSDLLLRNFRESATRKMGVDYQALQPHNPGLFYLYAGAYGADGPYAARTAYATTITVAAGGVARHLGWSRAFDVEAPAHDGPEPLTIQGCTSLTTNADATSALSAATALLMGLVARQRLGVGQYAMSSMLAASTYIVSDDFVRYPGKPAPALPDREGNGLGPLYRLYPTALGWVFLGAPSPRDWPALCGVVRRMAGIDLAGERRYATAADRWTHRDALARALTQAFVAATAEAWEREALSADVACVEVSEEPLSAVMMRHPHVLENGFAAEVDHPHFGRHTRHGPLVTMTSQAALGPGCLLGQHTRAVLAEIGYSEAEIDALKRRGIVAWPDT